MATTTTKPDVDDTGLSTGLKGSSWPRPREGAERGHEPSQRDALQALLAFSALHEQLRRRRALASQRKTFDSPGVVTNVVTTEFEPSEQFVLDEVLQLVADRAVAITGADGLAIALAENNEIVLRAAAGTVRPDVGARIDRDSAFSGACFRTAQVVHCDDTETDERVNLAACLKLGARSMVAVPLCGRRRVIGVLEAFSSYPFGFNDSDVRNLTLLAELILAACKPEDEDRFAESAQVAAKKLEPVVAAPVVAPLIAPAAITVKAVVPKANVPKKKIPRRKTLRRSRFRLSLPRQFSKRPRSSRFKPPRRRKKRHLKRKSLTLNSVQPNSRESNSARRNSPKLNS